MKENEDYVLVPAFVDNEQAWDVRILTGEFVETVIRFGNVEVDGIKGQINFNFKIISTPDDNLTLNDAVFQRTAGYILQDILENGVENGSLDLSEKE